jgi:hypothetical protein
MLRTTLSNGIKLYNNILYNNTGLPLVTKIYFSLESDYNTFYRTSGFRVIWNDVTYTSLASYVAATVLSTPTLWDTHSNDDDPIFIGPNGLDFTIPVGSPSNGTGQNFSSLYNTDYNNTTRVVPFDQGAYVAVPTAQLTNGTIDLSNEEAAQSSTATVQFSSPSISILPNWSVFVGFPDGFQFDNGGTTSVQNLTSMDGTVTVSRTGRSIKIQRNNDGTTATLPTISFDLTHLKNPFIPGTTDPYNILVKDIQNNLQALSSDVAGTDITGVEVPVATIAGGTVSGATTF